MDHASPAASKPRAPAASHCTACGAPVARQYFLVDGEPTCESCRAALAMPLSVGALARALGFGLAGALVGAALHWAVRATMGIEVGYVSLLIGFLVGAGVRRGARRRGLGLQLLAVALTYLAIALAYLPTMLAALSEHGVGPLGGQQLIVLAGLVLSLPLRIGFREPISLVITAIALFEAWKLTQRRAGVVSGPHSLPSVPAAMERHSAAPPPRPQLPPTPARQAQAQAQSQPQAQAQPVAAPALPIAAPSTSTRMDPQGGTLLDRAARQIADEEARGVPRVAVSADALPPRAPTARR